MSDYNNFDMSINEDRLLDAIREAKNYGLEPLVYINGLYYTINMKNAEKEAEK